MPDNSSFSPGVSSTEADLRVDIADSVDARGLSCPMPLLKAKLALNNVASGDVVRVLATDPGSVRDFHAFTQLSAHVMLSFVQHDDHYEYLLQKGELP